MVNDVAGAVLVKGDCGAAAVLAGRLLEGALDGLLVTLAYLRRLEAAQFALNVRKGRDGVARAARLDAADEYARLIVCD